MCNICSGLTCYYPLLERICVLPKGKTEKAEEAAMTALKNIIDTWNMIEKYGIEGYEVLDSMAVAVPDSEYERLLNSVKNKRYIQNLRRSSEWLAQRGYH